MITGSGIGRDCALTYAIEGALGVVFADLNEVAAQAAAVESNSMAKNPGYRALAVGVDVSDPLSVQAMVEKTLQAFGRIDYAVNSAGV